MIQLPVKFKKDIESRVTNLTPLVVIDDRIYLSTSKVTLNGIHYDPLISNTSSINDKIDIFNKKQSISNFNITAFNYEYNNKRLSDRLFASSVMNAKVEVYFKSQSARILADCLKVYSGYIRDIEENLDNLKIEIEDRT